MAEHGQRALVILRRRQVEARTGLAKSSLYDKVRAGDFPAPVKLGARSVGWYAHLVDDWLAARPTASSGRHA